MCWTVDAKPQELGKWGFESLTSSVCRTTNACLNLQVFHNSLIGKVPSNVTLVHFLPLQYQVSTCVTTEI